jgi:Zn ribbon nucleic-acid-binding protein
MNDGQFTPMAAVLWGTLPKEGRARILANLYCPECRDSVTISNYTGEEHNGDVILKGACPKCGHAVVRMVETSERDNSVN